MVSGRFFRDDVAPLQGQRELRLPAERADALSEHAAFLVQALRPQCRGLLALTSWGQFLVPAQHVHARRIIFGYVAACSLVGQTADPPEVVVVVVRHDTVVVLYDVDGSVLSHLFGLTAGALPLNVAARCVCIGRHDGTLVVAFRNSKLPLRSPRLARLGKL